MLYGTDGSPRDVIRDRPTQRRPSEYSQIVSARLPPTDPMICHITHVDNLDGILEADRLWCDAKTRELAAVRTGIGYQHIKDRRLRRRVGVGVGGFLGEYVPFNFCPRSVMLYAVAGGRTGYGGGQDPIVHLVSSVQRAIATGRPWAFTDRHADLGHAVYYDDLCHVGEVDWSVMSADQFWGGDSDLKERRQAEFLVHEWFPWTAVRGVVARTEATATQVRDILVRRGAVQLVRVKPSWYYERMP